ncbi:MAG: class I SAM-dependent methyltransferase [Porticoccaceae bacterium]
MSLTRHVGASFLYGADIAGEWGGYFLQKDYLAVERTKILTRFVPLNKCFCEIGAQARPTLLKTEASIHYLSYETQEEAKSVFADDSAMQAQVPETDILVRSDDYSQYTDMTFDCVIANHVIEHVDDIISWLQSISLLLKDDGIVFLAIPDKKYSQDKYRTNTTATHLIADYYLDGGKSERTKREHVLDCNIMYDLTVSDLPMRPDAIWQKENIEQQLNKPMEPGHHRHVFEAETFESQILSPLLFAQLADLKIVHCGTCVKQFGEFYCVLKKGRQETLHQDFLTKAEQVFAAGGSKALQEAVAGLGDACEEKNARINALEMEMAAMKRTISWRITGPIRKVRSMLRRAR